VAPDRPSMPRADAEGCGEEYRRRAGGARGEGIVEGWRGRRGEELWKGRRGGGGEGIMHGGTARRYGGQGCVPSLTYCVALPPALQKI
jgi:hypothetical protein